MSNKVENMKTNNTCFECRVQGRIKLMGAHAKFLGGPHPTTHYESLKLSSIPFQDKFDIAAQFMASAKHDSLLQECPCPGPQEGGEDVGYFYTVIV